jgi:hypothetical protein
MPAFPPSGAVTAFSDQLIALDLPGLPPDRRAAAVAFTGRRISLLPSPMRVGVGVVAVGVAALGKLVGAHRLVGFMAGHPMPVLGEYVRLVRSLSYAYVWDMWPATAPSGEPLTAEAR